VEEVLKAARRAADLTGQLLAFGRKQFLAPRVLDLNAVVREAERLLGPVVGTDVRLVTKLAPALGPVRIDPGQVRQVLLDLALNARDAMPRGGTLTVTTANVTLDAAYARSRLEVHPGPYVLLTVADTGTGMTPEVQARVFEPFFTTKGVGQGTGLGLAAVYGVVKQSGGHVEVESAPGCGTTFQVYLPRHEGAGPEPVVAAPAPAPGGTETLLLAEDEEQVREFVRLVLERRGYRVLAAADGPEALDLAARHPGPIHLLVTDVVMPGMSGWDLADRLAAVRPELRTLYLSGFTGDAAVRHGLSGPAVAFLTKPFTPDALVRKVREVLDR
jgi:CheY-like chemotaxis protein